jgi:hypothetical protein
MAVRVEYDEDQCQLVVQVACKDVKSDREIENTFNDLDTALGKIEEKLDSDIPFFLIDIEAKGVRPALGLFHPYEDGAEYDLGSRNPWEVFCPPFWTKTIGAPPLRQRAKDWIVRIEKTLKSADALSRSTASLWEDDETQFGEPLATHLALLDAEFVPYYTRLLRLWDQGHEVHMGGAVVEIVNKHGVRAETEELIVFYTEWSGSDELGLLELLRKAKKR